VLVAAKRTLESEDRSETIGRQGKASEPLAKGGPAKMAPSLTALNIRKFRVKNGVIGDWIALPRMEDGHPHSPLPRGTSRACSRVRSPTCRRHAGYQVSKFDTF
jgi:hypothetical protein